MRSSRISSGARAAGVFCVAAMSIADQAWAQHPYRLEAVSGASQVGFADHTVPALIRVRVIWAGGGPVDGATCVGLRVQFRTYLEGRVGPETQQPVWTPDEGCMAEARWRLADASGVQRVAATVHDALSSNVLSDPVVTEAVARAAPRLSFGLAMVVADRGILDLENVADTTLAASDNDRDIRVQPMMGVDFPLIFFNTRPPILERLRLFIGFGFENPTREFFWSLKVLPWTHEYEDLPIHFNVGVRVQRLTVTVTGTDCMNLSAAGRSCTKTDMQFNPFLSVTVETQTLLDPILQAIGIG